MKKLLLLFSILLYSFISRAQITGSDTACAGYIYTYSVNMPGAVTFNWTLPTGWYFISGQGTNSVVVNCNVNVGQVCVTGYDGSAAIVGSVCKTVAWGTGGIGWYVDGIATCLDPPCCSQHSYILNVLPQGSACPGGCGNGYQNPNIIFGGFDNAWPSGNYLGQVNGSTGFFDFTGFGTTVYVYPVDSTFGINNLILVSGQNGCGPVNNTFFIPPDPPPQIVIVPLIQTPYPVCVGDTFVISMDSFYSSNINIFNWYVFSGTITLIGSVTGISVTAVLNGPGPSTIYFNGSDFTGCHLSGGDINIYSAVCSAPSVSFSSNPTSLCPGSCINFTNNTQNATSYQWSFPGATPSSSIGTNPTNICYNSPGNYDVTLIAVNIYGSDTVTLTNYIHVYTAPIVSIIQNGDTLITPPGFAGYQWFYNGNLIPGAVSYQYIAAQTGSYSVAITDGNGCVGGDTIGYSSVAPIITGSDTACAGYIYTYTVYIPGAVTYNWTLSPGWYFLNGQGTDSIVVICDSSASGSICVTGFDASGNPIDSVCQVIQPGTNGGSGFLVNLTGYCLDFCCFFHDFVATLTPVSCGPGGGGCGNGSVNPNITFGIFSNPAPFYGTFLGIVGVTHLPSGIGWIYVYPIDTTFGVNNLIHVYYSGAGGCGDNSAYIPPDNPPPPFTVTLIQEPNPVCVGDTFVISIDAFSLSQIGFFNWSSFSSSVTLIGSTFNDTVIAVLTGTGSPSISFSGSDWTDCYHFYGSINITYSLSCAPVISSLTSTTPSLCAGSCVNFTSTSANATSYQWFFQGGMPDTSTAVNPGNICYPDSGQYDVMLIATNSFGSDTLFLNNYISVFPQPQSFTIIQSHDTLFAQQGFANYQWYHDTIVISGANNYYYVVTQDGDYNLVVSDNNGCQVGAGILDVEVGIGESPTFNSQMFVYPNPAQDEITVFSPQFVVGNRSDICTLNVYDMLGNEIYSQRIKTVTCKLLTANWSSGIYLLKASYGKNTWMKKIVIQR